MKSLPSMVRFSTFRHLFMPAAGAVASVFFPLAGPSHADIHTWNGGDNASDIGWSHKQNWGTNKQPLAGDDLVFGGTVKLANTNDIAAGTSFSSITFNNTAGAFILSGNAITLGAAVTNDDADTQTIDLGLILSGTRTFNAASGNLAVGGVIGESSSGIGVLIKTGGNTLTLTNSNTYSGDTSVNQGKLSLAGGGGIASSAVITVASGAQLNVSGVTGANWTVGGATAQKLSGTGVVEGATTTIGSNGTLTAGVSFNGGTTNHLDFASGSIFEWDISNTGTYSVTDVGGGVTGGSAVFKIGVSDFSNVFWDSNHSWNIGNIFSPGSGASTLSGIFGTLTTNQTAVGGGPGFSLNSISGTLNWTAIPEPSGVVAGILLAAGLLVRRRQAMAGR